MNDWLRCLEALEDHLARQGDAVAQGRPEDVVAFVPPTGLGPVPAALAQRLRVLAERNEVLTAALVDASAAAARQLQLVSTMQSRPPAGAAYVDARG